MSAPEERQDSAFRRFLTGGSAGGVLLALAAALALVASNSRFGEAYADFQTTPGEIAIGRWLALEKPLVIWVNDLWMGLFFLLVGLEIKRELFAGELSSRAQALLPCVAALGGMVVPAALYAALNSSDRVARHGWAIPSATDIAFTLGIVALLGRRVPASLRVFLTAVAVIDDLGAIVAIAVFYTHGLSLPMLGAAGLGALVLFALNRARVSRSDVYLVVGLLMWVCVLKSGVHATLAGVVTALAIPLRDRSGGSPLARLEHALHPWVTFLVLPMFAFLNAGVPLDDVSLETFAGGIPLGIALGLVVGKPVGIFGASWLLFRYGGAHLPTSTSKRQFFAASVLCGIGFTMSLFIGGLAFQGLDERYATELRLGVLGGSLVSALLGTTLMLVARRPDDAATT